MNQLEQFSLIFLTIRPVNLICIFFRSIKSGVGLLCDVIGHVNVTSHWGRIRQTFTFILTCSITTAVTTNSTQNEEGSKRDLKFKSETYFFRQ